MGAALCLSRSASAQAPRSPTGKAGAAPDAPLREAARRLQRPVWGWAAVIMAPTQLCGGRGVPAIIVQLQVDHSSCQQAPVGLRPGFMARAPTPLVSR